jgi:Family of unknown function (DUF5946)
MIPCVGCGALVPDSTDPTHKYIGSSPGCWSIYCEVLAKEYSDYRFGAVHRLTVDTYAVQHPGKPERRTIQSVAVHLIGLHLSIELDFDSRRAVKILQAAADRSSSFVWLDPPESLGSITIIDVHHAGDNPQEHKRLVNEWARSTWAAWAKHQPQIRKWASQLTTDHSRNW